MEFNADIIHEQFTQLLNEGEYSSAESLLLNNIRYDMLNAQLWLDLGEALRINGYGNEARKVFRRARILDSGATWEKEVQDALEKTPIGSERKDIQALLDVPKASVCVAIIVKNEEGTIERCLNSIINAVDEIVVVDTGSTDTTVDKIKKYEQVKLYHFQWNDSFAEARNFGLSKLESDWVLWLDADESLHPEDIDIIREIVGLYQKYNFPSVLCVSIINKISNSEVMDNDIPRLFPTKINLFYSGCIHEQLYTTNESMQIQYKKVFLRIIHTGYDPNVVITKNKVERNLNLLKKNIEEDSLNPYWRFLYGRELYQAGEYESSIKELKKSIEIYLTQGAVGRTLDAFYFLACAYYSINNDAEAEKVCLEGLKISNDFPNFHIILAYIYSRKIDKYTNMLNISINNSVQSFNSYRGLVSPDFSILQWRSDLLNAELKFLNGDLIEAKELYEKVYNIKFDDLNIKNKINYIQERINNIKSDG